MKRIILIIFLLTTIIPLFSQSMTYAVRVSATVQEDPPQLTFTWPEDPSALRYHIFRKHLSDTSWGDPVAVLNGSGIQFIDTNIATGEAYEYGFYKTLNRFSDTLVLTNGTHVTFTVHDSWGDGMCCHHGQPE